MREGSVRNGVEGRLQYREDGDLDGFPVFALHGTPGCRIWPAWVAEDARRKRIRLIGYDRPGYGLSTSAPGRTIADVANDVGSIADALGLDRFGVWGFSGGGAPALACAAMLPDRVAAAASLAGVAPYAAEGLVWYDGMGELNVADYRLMIDNRPAWERKSRKDWEDLVRATADQIRAMWATLMSPTDLAAMNEQVASFLLTSIQEGLRPGDEGLKDDNLSQIQPWGCDLATIRVPVQVWHGGQDRFVPIGHGRWLASHIPKAEAHLLADEGHLTLFLNHTSAVQSWLAAKA